MTEPMPDISQPVTVSDGERDYESRVELIDGRTVVVAAPFNETVEIPDIGSMLKLGWVAGPRGRYVVDAKLTSTSRVEGVPMRCWTLALESAPEINQRRRFVRAGGGESVRVRLKDRDDVVINGSASDISEGGVRFRVQGAKPDDPNRVKLDNGVPVSVVVHLDEDMLDADGAVLRTIEDQVAHTVDMIVTLRLTERQAERVRRYVMRQQVLARRAAADAEY
ncbi:PilZ domain-containing protein [Planosporangium sp. 12N6]|uniref:PilZ domain-containing protein n=1 Tax=Planosporangium spinosum TaxID=3402278 RepID=UPI003CFA230C